MTTVVYRSGVMAADSRGYGGGCPPVGRKFKIRHLKGGWLVGATAGSKAIGVNDRIFKWLGKIADNHDLATFDWETAPNLGDISNYSVLLVSPDGWAFYFDDSLFPAGPLYADYFVAGSGREFALGALECGASAVEAVRVACRLDVWSGAPIDALKHDGHSWQAEAVRPSLGLPAS